MKPYKYQEPIVSVVHSALLQVSVALMVLATGVGKTAIAAFITRLLSVKTAKVLFLCHDTTILEQSAKTFSKVCGSHVRSGFFNGKSRPGKESNFVFATFQSLTTHKKTFKPDEFKLVIVDEAHHAQAGTYAPVVRYFKPKYLLGMTATPNRSDTLCIRDIFGEEVVNIGLEEAVAKKYLCPLDYRVFTDNLDTKVMEELLREAEDTGRRVSMEEINRSVFIQKRDEEIAKVIEREAGERVIVFCRNVEHAEEFAKQLPKTRTTILHSRLKPGEQEKAHEGFKSGKYRFILVVDKYNEGVDVPEADTVVFLRTTDSATIFLQQLGRGLRKSPGKKKLVVLDFVANCDRFHTVRKMALAIFEISQKDGSGSKKEKLRISGVGFSFEFSEDQLTLAELMEKTERSFYLTWEEASKAALNLSFLSSTEYKAGYTSDTKLPSSPNVHYENSDWPGWRVFLSTKKYPTWQEASEAACELGFSSEVEYKDGYKRDVRLPQSPYHKYRGEFPGWVKFLKLEKVTKYPTWQEAGAVSVNAGFKTSSDYIRGYKDFDIRLPNRPDSYYENSGWPGWQIFLSVTGNYLTWQEASKAATRLNITCASQYKKRYKEDPRLVSSPQTSYSDFPGWVKFLKLEKVTKYPTWQEASEAACELGFSSEVEYKDGYKRDVRLPQSPYHKYRGEFPGWVKFLKLEKVTKYPTWQEASEAAQRLEIKTTAQYVKGGYKADPRLPAALAKAYEDFPGMSVFLGNSEKYSTWQEASEVAKKLSVTNWREYHAECGIDPRLPVWPNKSYSDFPGLAIYLGAK